MKNYEENLDDGISKEREVSQRWSCFMLHPLITFGFTVC